MRIRVEIKRYGGLVWLDVTADRKDALSLQPNEAKHLRNRLNAALSAIERERKR